MRSIFISYRRLDSEDVVGRIFSSLKVHFAETELFQDTNSIPLAVNFVEYIDKALADCGVVLAIIGREWLTVADDSGNPRLFDKSDFVRVELEAALAREIPIIPVLVRRAGMPKPEKLPESLVAITQLNAIQLRADPDYEGDIARLIREVKSILGTRNQAKCSQNGSLSHPLHAFPRGPRVDDTLVTPRLIEAFAQLNAGHATASNLLRKASQDRKQADPGDDRVTVPKMAELPNIEFVGARNFWTAAFYEVCSHGPRMLAALLHAQPDDQFNEGAQRDRNALLAQIRDSK